MGLFSLAKLFGITIRESANDGSDFTNPDADFRRLFLGEDGQLHVKDSAGTVTDIGTGGGSLTDHTHAATGSGSTGGGATLQPTTLDIPSASSPAQTAEGRAVWDSDDDVLTVGTGAARKTLGYLGSTVPGNTPGSASAGTGNEVSKANHDHGISAGAALSVERIGGGSTTTDVTTIQVAKHDDNGGGEIVLLPQITGTGAGAVVFASTATSLKSPDENAVLELDNGGGMLVGIYYTGAGDQNDKGIDLQFGPDLVGLRMSEKSSSVMQLYADYSGGYDIELKDRGSGKNWQMVNTAGDVSIPSMGRLRKLSAAPGSPTEGDSYYNTTTHKTQTYDGTSWQNHW